MKTLKQLDPRYKIDESRKVFIYKNLHKDCWSIKQDGLVKAHTTDLSLFDCSFRVNAKGREKVLKERRKNVHAGISGYIDNFHGVDPAEISRVVTYNPYKYDSFVDKTTKEPIYYSQFSKLSHNQVLVA